MSACPCRCGLPGPAVLCVTARVRSRAAGLGCSDPSRTSSPQSSALRGARTGSLTCRGHLCQELWSRCTSTILYNNIINKSHCESSRWVKLTTEESLLAAAALHTQPGSLWCRHGSLEAGNKSGAGFHIPADPVLRVNNGGFRRSAAHISPDYRHSPLESRSG